MREVIAATLALVLLGAWQYQRHGIAPMKQEAGNLPAAALPECYRFQQLLHPFLGILREVIEHGTVSSKLSPAHSFEKEQRQRLSTLLEHLQGTEDLSSKRVSVAWDFGGTPPSPAKEAITRDSSESGEFASSHFIADAAFSRSPLYFWTTFLYLLRLPPNGTVALHSAGVTESPDGARSTRPSVDLLRLWGHVQGFTVHFDLPEIVKLRKLDYHPMHTNPVPCLPNTEDSGEPGDRVVLHFLRVVESFLFHYYTSRASVQADFHSHPLPFPGQGARELVLWALERAPQEFAGKTLLEVNTGLHCLVARHLGPRAKKVYGVTFNKVEHEVNSHNDAPNFESVIGSTCNPFFPVAPLGSVDYVFQPRLTSGPLWLWEVFQLLRLLRVGGAILSQTRGISEYLPPLYLEQLSIPILEAHGPYFGYRVEILDKTGEYGGVFALRKVVQKD
eukprot:TRINITY_DN12583_c0_g1_i1.p1 TRINITY_DN12583_c0_g1~~TRINITY_DN12583_c0_g1_i1.p1  ORF type:complete len:457 (-),score=58.94 TRINITY_DN12583_c0_g1_i1:29-1369(-)